MSANMDTSELLTPGSLPGHNDLETMARRHWMETELMLWDAKDCGINIASATIESLDGNTAMAILKIRQAMWPAVDHKGKQEVQRVITRSLGFAAVLSAALHAELWVDADVGPAKLTLHSLDPSPRGLRPVIESTARSYFRNRRGLRKLAKGFIGPVITENPGLKQDAAKLCAFGLHTIDVDLQRQYFAGPMADFYREIDGYDGSATME